MNALADPEVGSFISKYFVSSFQRVGTFRIQSGQKQGGNVAAYFCAADGRVLHAIAGPVKARELLEEAEWVVASTRDAITASKGDATRFKQTLRRLHADRLEEKYGVTVSPVLQDGALQNLQTATAYRDREGRRLAPVLPLPAIENRASPRAQLTNQAKVHQLLAAHTGQRIENLYGAVFQGILNERISTKPVETDTPFPASARRK